MYSPSLETDTADVLDSHSESPGAKRRVTTVTDKEVQYGVVRKIAMHWIAFMICNSAALVMWVILFEQPDAKWSDTLRICVQRFLPFFIISAALIPAFVVDTLKMTSRFAGPISRLRTEIANVTAGRPVTKLSFRSTDYWCEIANGFNAMVDKIDGADKAPSTSGKSS